MREQAGPPRVGFTVSKQVGNAVERNRVRRRLRELVRLASPAALRVSHDYVLIGRRSALKAPFGDMIKEFDGALRRVHASGKGLVAAGGPRDQHPHTASPLSRPRRQRPTGINSMKPQADQYEH
jgi:ribonuclease P protein component